MTVEEAQNELQSLIDRLDDERHGIADIKASLDELASRLDKIADDMYTLMEELHDLEVD